MTGSISCQKLCSIELDNSKDLAIAILGGSVSLAGLLLVFSGFLFSQAESFPPEHTDDKTIKKYKNAARFGVVPFVGCLMVTWIAAWWLRSPSPTLFQAAWYGFTALLVLTGLYGGIVIARYLS